jgi:hypothetical protein
MIEPDATSIVEPDATATVEPPVTTIPPTPTPPALRWPNPFPTAEEVEVDPDGKYVIRQRVDGCDYSEDQRTVRPEDGRLWVLLRSPECALVGLLVPGRHSALEVVPIPTVAASATPEPSPTPTPEPGVCPTPYRRVAAVPGMLGGRMEGGTSYQQGYLTLHFPAGREFIVSSGVDSHEGLSFAVYDVTTQSALSIRGDGCEVGRTIGDVAADAVFDEIVASLEVGSSYVCPSGYRSLLAPDEIPSDPSRLGQPVTGGAPEAERLGLHLPAGREFVVWHGIADPGGGFTGIYDIAARSYLFLGADGCEWSRRIADPAADAVFDEIVGAIQVPLVRSPPGP